MATYTDEQQEQAVRLSEEVGPAEASRQLDIPLRTLNRWRNEAGVAQANAEKTADARAKAAERVSTEWADYRSKEAIAAGAEANHVRRKLRETVDSGPANDAYKYALVYGILIDKAEKLSNQATERIEVWAESEVDRDLREAIGELEERIRAGS